MGARSREYDLWSQKTQILKSRCHTKETMGAAMHAHPSFGMTTTKTLRSVFSWCASKIFRCVLASSALVPSLMWTSARVKIRGTRFSASALKSTVQEISNGIWHAYMWCNTGVSHKFPLSNIEVSYTVEKLSNSTFRYMCKLWESRGTRTCIRVHVMGTC